MKPEQRDAAPVENERRFDDAVIGETDLGIETSKTVFALTKASRACLLYDFDNEAVAEFLHELDLRMERLLAHGSLHLEVHPWELMRDSEVVYRDQDREKSLAFRLYYDGVRSLTFHPDVTWDELTRLVGILSIRYTGIRQQEDDVVTLLWKANFKHIDFDTVESYTPVDDENRGSEGLTSSLERRKGLYDPEHEFNLPWPELTDESDIEFRAIPADSLHKLQQEDRAAQLPDLCLQLVNLLSRHMTETEEEIPVDGCVPLFHDIRDYLLSEHSDQHLLEAVRIVHRSTQHLTDPAARASLLAVFTDRQAFASMVDAAIEKGQSPEVLVEIISAVPIDQLEVLLQVLASRWSGAGRELGRRILTEGLEDRIQQIAEVALATSGTVSADILEIAAQLDPDAAVPLALAMVRRNDRPSRLKAIEILEQLPYSGETGRVLSEFGLKSNDSEVRSRAAQTLAVKGETRAVPAIARAIQASSESGASAAQLITLAKALARLDPTRAVQQFREWARIQGRRQRGRSSAAPSWQVAVDTLAEIPGRDATELLLWFRSRGDGELKARCERAISRQKGLAGRE